MKMKDQCENWDKELDNKVLKAQSAEKYERLKANPLDKTELCLTASAAVKHMHDRNTPVTHRHIKIKNLLFTSDGFTIGML
jgi:serine/threonine protein kinase